MRQKAPNPRASSWVLDDPNENMIQKISEGNTAMMTLKKGP